MSADTSGEFEVLSLAMDAGRLRPCAVASNSHASEECAVVLSGEVVAEVAGQRYELADGTLTSRNR